MYYQPAKVKHRKTYF